MKHKAKAVIFWALGLSVAFAAAPGDSVAAAEKRCMLMDGKRVECPVQSDAALGKAQLAYEAEGDAMASGQGGSTYGIAPFDQLTGVGKLAKKEDGYKVASGYGNDTGKTKTELWNRVKKPGAGESVYNQWTNNWSPSFSESLVPGADPNEGKQWYYVYCIGCHGWLLNGDGPVAAELDPKPRILTAGKYMNHKSNLQLFTVIKGGGEAVDLSGVMPSWGNYLQDQDIWNVVAWIRAMADVKAPGSVKEYLAPKSSYKPVKGDMNPLTASNSEEFKEAQETLEYGMAGRGGNHKGGGYVDGGMRKAPKDVKKKVSGGY
jgi:mono/diheme cytochrome c family protein